MKKALRLTHLVAGFDNTSLDADQYFELGQDWVKLDEPLSPSVVHAALFKAITSNPPTSRDVTVPMEAVAEELEARYPGRWTNAVAVGERGPLFWINDGIEREGCQLVPDGVVCYSERAGKGFLSWGELFGKKFIEKYEQQKMGVLLDEYWFNGKTFFKVLHGSKVSIQRDQLVLELRQAGFDIKKKANQNLSEVEAAILTISNQNRVAEVAPVIFSKEKIVTFNGNRILNTSDLCPVAPAGSGDKRKWPFINRWLNQLFVQPKKGAAPLDYFYAWLQRFYLSVHNRVPAQGQALILVGPTNKGKSLLSNRVVAGLVGGFADASEYLSGGTTFNKDLGRVAAWVVDDTTSAASFQDQRRMTELIKRAVANPRLEYMAKYVDAISIPWAGRVILSLNMDANSLSVIPAMDSSNRDKLMALRISDKATSSFPANHLLEKTIDDELPYFAKFLTDYVPPKAVNDLSRFGVASYIDEQIASAAYDNSSRSAIAELVDYFCKELRKVNGSPCGIWTGTLIELQTLLHSLNDGRTVGMSNNLEFVRRGLQTMEDNHRAGDIHTRPVESVGTGGGKMWKIDTDSRFDIC